jgi:hypothetical protein
MPTIEEYKKYIKKKNKTTSGRWYLDPVAGVPVYSSFKTKKAERNYYAQLAQKAEDPQVAASAARMTQELGGQYTQPVVQDNGKVTGMRTMNRAAMTAQVAEIMDPAVRQNLMVYLLQLRQRMASRAGRDTQAL